MAAAFGGYGISQSDVLECNVHLGGTDEVSSFELVLDNYSGKYSPGGQVPLSVGMDGSISIGRGAHCPQIITCRIEKMKYEAGIVRRVVRINGRCWGERLFRRVFTGTFENMKGEDIVKYLLDYYVGLSHVRGSTELVEATDTTYTRLEYENTPVWDIIRYVAESADKQGIIGFDFRVAYDGKFEFFPKGSKTSPVSLADCLEEEIEYERDISRVRNRVFVLGSGGKKLPDDLNEDGLTESITHWLPIYPSHTLSLNIDHVKQDGEVGYSDSYSVQAATGGSAPLNKTGMMYVFTSGPIKIGGPAGFKRLRFWLYWNRLFTGAPPQSVKIMLYTDSSNYFYQDITGIAGSQGEWRKIELSLEAAWGVVGDPSLNQIIAVGFHIEFADNVYPLMRVDHIVFEDARFSALIEDSNSKNAYGLRELTETDEELTSDDACLRRAKALLNHLKSPAEHVRVKSTVLDYGNNPILPGDMIHVPFLDADYRVSSVEYHVDGETQTLEVSLELGLEPPLLADYLYGLRSTTVTVEKLARTKLGKETKLTRAPTGHDHAGDVLRPNAVNCNELTVAGKAIADEVECNRLSVADPLAEIEVSGKASLSEVETNKVTCSGKVTANQVECNESLTIAQTLTCNNVQCNQVSAAVGVTANQVNCNYCNAAVGCNKGYENCPKYGEQGDITFVNKFRITEAENLGLPRGLAFLNPEGKVLVMLTENNVFYKALGQFDSLNSLALIRRVRDDEKKGESRSLADLGSLPLECAESDLINAGVLTGLLIDAIKQLAAKVESLEKLRQNLQA